MNAGLTNLDGLRKQLLANSLTSEVRFDQVLSGIGLGVAGAFEGFCNRKFWRTTGDTFICAAGRAAAFVPRYPVEAVTKLELKVDTTGGWVEQAGAVLNWSATSGLVYWGAALADDTSQVRITYTGGFWWETLEPEDGGYPSAMPAGATALPDDLRLSFLLQCGAVWQAIDKTGEGLLTTGSNAQFVSGSLAGLDLVPSVKATLMRYVRYQI